MATLGIRDAFEIGDPRLGMAVAMAAIPLLIVPMALALDQGGGAVTPLASLRRASPITRFR
ncbi:MAG: hypothetical protein ABI369_09000 [Acetobacteraceae bacterium]